MTVKYVFDICIFVYYMLLAKGVWGKFSSVEYHPAYIICKYFLFFKNRFPIINNEELYEIN